MPAPDRTAAPASGTAAPASGPAARGRRRRWWLWPLGALALIVVLLGAGPWIAAPWVAGALVDGIEQGLDARATLGRLSLRHGAGAEVRDLVVTDAERAPVLSVGRLDASVDLLGALAGRYDVSVELTDFRLDVRRGADGRLNLQSIVRPTLDDEGLPRQRGDPSPGGTAWPAVRARLDARGGRVVVHGEGGTTELRDITVSVLADGLDAPVPVEFSAGLSGPSGPGGTVRVQGEVRLDRAAGAFTGATLDYALQDLLLDALAPAAAALADLDELSGRLVGSGRYEVSADPLRVEGRSELALTAAQLGGPAFGGRVPVPDMTLTTTGAATDAVLGTQTLVLDAGTALRLELSAGPGFGPAAGAGGAWGARLAASGRLAGLADLARPWVPLQSGLAVDGGLSAAGEFTVVLADGGPTSARMDVSTQLTGVSARDASGAERVPAEMRDVRLSAAGGFDRGAGRADLQRLELLAGPVHASGRAALSGLPAAAGDDLLGAVAVEDASLALQADLDRLAEALASFLDLGGASLGGRVDLAVEGGRRGEATGAEAVLTASGLRVDDGAGLGLALRALSSTTRWDPSRGPFAASGELTADGLSLQGVGSAPVHLEQVTAGYAAAFDPTDARVVFDSLALTIPGAHLSGGGAWWLDPSRAPAPAEPGRLDLALSVDPRAAGAAFAPLLGGLSLDGEPLEGRLLLVGDGGSHVAQGKLEGRRLALGLPGAAAPLVQRELSLVFNVEAPGPRRLHVRTLELRTATAGVSLQGGLELGDAGAPAGLAAADLSLDVHGELPRQLTDLAALAPLPVTPASGQLASRWTARLDGGRWSVAGRSTVDRLSMTLPPASAGGVPLVIDEPRLGLDVDAALGLAPLAVDLGRLAVDSSFVRGEFRGAIEVDEEGELIARGVEGELRYVPDTLGALIGPWLPVAWSGSGTETLTLSADGALADLSVDLRAGTGTITVEDLDVTGTVQLRLRDGAGTLDGDFDADHGRLSAIVAADLALGPPRVDLRRADLDSDFLQGGLTGRVRLADAGDAVLAEGLRGEFTYVPDEVAALLGDLLPVKLSGTQREQVSLSLDGPIPLADPLAALQTAQVDVRGGTGHLAALGFDVAGGFGLAVDEGLARLAGDWTVNEGTATLALDLDGRPVGSPVSRLDLDLREVAVTRELGALLAQVHPLFVPAGDDQGGVFQGKVSLQAHLEYPGALVDALLARPGAAGGATAATLAERLAALPLAPLVGDVTLTLSEGLLAASPLQAQMLSKLGFGSRREVSLQPIKLRIADERISYAEPWVWTLDGHDTRWTGSMGFDQRLDMEWGLPITQALVERHGKLQPLLGEQIELAVTGLATAPKIHFEELLPKLVEKAFKAKVTNPIDAALGKGPEDPADLLKQADELWAEGKRTEAQALYERLRETYRFTLVYQLNKKHIDKRAKGKD